MSRDKVSEAIVEALKQLLSGPDEQRLHRSGKLDGLFASRAGVNGEAAARALREGLVEVVRTETRGKTLFEWVRLTPKGVEFLAEVESPVRALQELRDVLRANREAAPAWIEDMRSGLRTLADNIEERARGWLTRLEGLSRRVEDALARLDRSRPILPDELVQRVPWAPAALTYLDQRQQNAASPCTLPELFQALQTTQADLSVPAFHDGLRHLQERRVLQLLPAADAAELTRPEFALFQAGRVFYAVAA